MIANVIFASATLILLQQGSCRETALHHLNGCYLRVGTDWHDSGECQWSRIRCGLTVLPVAYV